MALTVAIIGRPNVGKSTLFNRLAGRRIALVHDTPGVTRDRIEAEAALGPLCLRIIDTAGFEDAKGDTLPARMVEQTRTAIREADVCLLVIDGREGVTAGDEIIAAELRKSGKPVVLATNKIEGRAAAANVNEGFSLGFGEPVTLSAEHGIGFGDLLEALSPFAQEEEESKTAPQDEGNKPLKLAIVGRPNVGKSSLFNALIGEERALTSPEAGTTRDAVIAKWEIGGRAFLLHDTAGLRKKARAAGHTLEELSVESTLEAIRFAECVIMLVDATAPFEKQDLSVVDMVAREGRAIVFAINKFDLLENRTGAISRFRVQRDELLPQVFGAPLIATSARTGEGIERVLEAVRAADKAWNTRVGTGELNRFIEQALSQHPPPAIHGRRVRIRYVTQPKARPPTFALFGNQLNALPDSYLRYLQNALRETFNLYGTPLRFSLRTSKNPYAR
ncbi:MAG TPA: ribosome biogenesis GTPase Der [Rhizomicrobium sp.]|jgi:GTP-binding protein|nr:ribosome biogenesis GTPase Der [Rhizomicrobium sp.]